ncbi:putative Aminotransferase, class V (purine catabolism protein PucG) [Desulfamplus magnetovallimortis]|uniref:Putative Aminotransferase, class V (Purine catabolism protein PucG) n=1 Tax=Desulfamplus magnetovallimortis TaxID=1246637 RepID=A0A1W1HHX0_9BACT|nr:alanine--glyoxylate aminotransferase family protein [Desulfamplus magnetovallimortis]SLM31968.1 putative Aminotransferase, class V (purine catabolism protein PucG) [Desulfamplus magnetovallimortis]
MNNLLDDIQKITLMGPGPSCVDDSVLNAMAKDTIGHLDPAFIKIMDTMKGQLKTLLHTENQLTIPVSGTGSAGMESCFVNLIEKGDAVLVLINGVFGMRMQDVATRLGADVDTLEFEWGTPVIVDDVKKQIAKKAYKIVAVVHAETSTGVKNPVAEIGALVKGSDTIYLVDAVTSFGGIEITMDAWGIDVLYSGTQKCLSCPPGLAPISFSEKAVAAIKQRKTKVPNWYLDLTMIMNYWAGATRAYHHTAPINMLYGLYQALYLILEEGEDAVYKRHMDNHLLLVDGLKEIGINMLVDESCRLPMLNSVHIPEGADDAAVRSRLLKEFKIEIGAGLGPLAGKIWRIGLMGHTARPENVEKLLTALKKVL